MSATAGSDLAKAAHAPLGLVLMLGSLMVVGPLSIDMYLPALPAIGASLHARADMVQVTASSFFIGIAVGQLFYGPLSDRFGRRPLLLIGFALYALASLFCALAPTIEALIAFRVLQALGGCAGMVMSRAVVRDRFQANEVLHVLSLMMLVMGIAPMLAPLVGGWVLLVAEWRWIFGVQVVFASAVWLAVFLRLPESRSEATAAQARGENPLRAYAALLSQPRLVGYILAGASSGAALFTYIACSPDIIISLYHVPPVYFGWVFGVNALGLIGATQVNARLARRYSPDLILSWALIAALVAGMVMLACASTGFLGMWGVLVPMFLVMTSLGFTQGNTAAAALSVDATRSGATAALMGASSFAAGSVFSALAGWFRDGTARPMAAVIALSMLVAVISLRTLAPRLTRSRA